jgi:hypothetical protein
MSKLLEKAFEEASKLPKREQEALAQWLLAELESERRWEERLSESAGDLARLADEALDEHRRGATGVLDIDKL